MNIFHGQSIQSIQQDKDGQKKLSYFTKLTNYALSSTLQYTIYISLKLNKKQTHCKLASSSYHHEKVIQYKHDVVMNNSKS